MNKKYYYIYKLTNLVNDKIYVGKHSTEDLDDGYMGSGKLVQLAEKKYGLDSFKKDILCFCDSEEELNRKEAEIVNEEFLKRDDVYNLKLGGDGGWDHVNNLTDNEFKCICGYTTNNITEYAVHCHWCKIRNSAEEIEKRKAKSGWSKGLTVETDIRVKKHVDTLKENYKLGKIIPSWIGRKHTKSQKDKVKETMSNLVQIYNPQLDKRTSVDKLVLDDYLKNGWIIGRGKYKKHF